MKAARPVIHLLIAESSSMMRKLIRHLLDEEPTIRVVADVGTLEEALRITVDTAPDILLMDLHLQQVEEYSAVLIRLAFLSYVRHILAMSTRMDLQTRELAVSYGAIRLLDKFGLSDELIPTILHYGRSPARHHWQKTIPGPLHAQS